PFVARGEPRMKGADLGRLEPGAPAQSIHRVTAGRQQMAPSALTRADPLPSAVPVGDVRQILGPGEPDVPEPSRRAEPACEFQKRVVAEHKGHDRPDAGRPDRIANADELANVEAGRLLEHKVLARVGRSDGLIGVKMVRGGDRDNVDVSRGEHVLVTGRELRGGQLEAVAAEVGAGPRNITRAEPRNRDAWITVKRRDVLRRAPADAGNGDSELALRRGHDSRILIRPRLWFSDQVSHGWILAQIRKFGSARREARPAVPALI